MNNALEKMTAIEVHREIINNGNLAASAIAEMAKNLKRMRDEKLYIDLGYDKFDTYCEDMAGIKARHAYNFIFTLERIGEDNLQLNANMGITKLALIAQLPPEDREEIIENPAEIEGMTVPEIKEMVDKIKKTDNQIKMFETDIKTKDKDIKDLKKSIDTMKREIADKESKIKELEDKPVTVDISEQRAEEIRHQIESAYADKIAAMEKQLKLSDNETAVFKVYLSNLREAFETTLDVAVNSEQSDKFKAALLKLLNGMIVELNDET